jgi:hypothetical protein
MLYQYESFAPLLLQVLYVMFAHAIVYHGVVSYTILYQDQLLSHSTLKNDHGANSISVLNVAVFQENVAVAKIVHHVSLLNKALVAPQEASFVTDFTIIYLLASNLCPVASELVPKKTKTIHVAASFAIFHAKSDQVDQLYCFDVLVVVLLGEKYIL